MIVVATVDVHYCPCVFLLCCTEACALTSSMSCWYKTFFRNAFRSCITVVYKWLSAICVCDGGHACDDCACGEGVMAANDVLVCV